MKKTKLLTHKDFKRESMKRPGVRKAHAELELEFKILDALIRTRIKKKLTQRALAEQIGVAQSALARFESGKISPTILFVQKVASGLGLRLTVK
ncbi:MAG: helix-turn-helix transcriptional regulator [Candidatus Yonathbacteria bacterium]|nr:helix-turn-helix transcriptional regulator [Candidatus Yonathbacteria bacterium]